MYVIAYYGTNKIARLIKATNNYKLLLYVHLRFHINNYFIKMYLLNCIKIIIFLLLNFRVLNLKDMNDFFLNISYVLI